MMRALFLVLALWGMATPALAQTRANGQIDAMVQLERAPEPPLELTPINALEFGTVAIPNTSMGNSSCSYVLSEKGVSRIDERRGPSGSFVTLAAQATSGIGCRFATAPKVGVLQLTCLAGRQIKLTTTYSAVAGLATGLQFNGQTAPVVTLTNADGSDSQDAGNFFPITCAPNATAGTVVKRHIHMGGILDVESNTSATPGSSLKVGVIQIDVSYP